MARVVRHGVLIGALCVIAVCLRQPPVHASRPAALPVTVASACANPFPAGPLPSGASPVAVAVDPTRGRLYIVHRAVFNDVGLPALTTTTNRVSVVDQTTGAILATVPTGTSYLNNGATQGIAVDTARNTVWVTNGEDDTVSVIDAAANPPAVVATVAITDPASVTVDASMNRVFVATASSLSGTLVVLDATTRAIVKTITLSAPAFGVAVDTSTHDAYVVMSFQSYGIINGTTLQVSEKKLNTTAVAPQAAAVKNGSRLYLAYQNIVAVVDISGSSPSYSELSLISVSSPNSMAVDQTTGKLYVVDTTNETLNVFTSDGATAASPIKVQRLPSGVAVDASVQRAYVTDTLRDGLTVINTSTWATAGRIVLGTTDFGLAYDGVSSAKRLYAANFAAGTISVVDPSTCGIVASWPTGEGPWSIAVDPGVQQLYALNISERTGTLAIHSTTDGSIKQTISIGAAAAGRIAVNRTTHEVWVTAGTTSSNVLTVVNGTTNSVSGTLTVGSRSVGVAIDEAADRVYVANLNAGTISVIRGSTKTVIATWNPPQSSVWGLALDVVGKRLYVTIAKNTIGSFNGVIVLDSTTGASLGQVSLTLGLESETTIGLVAVNPTTQHAFVTLPNDDTVAVIDPANGYSASLVDVGSTPHDVVVDSATGAVYVGNALNGTISSFTDTPCVYSIAPASQTVPPTAGTGSVTVSTSTSCAWTAASNASWLSIAGGASGTGSGTVSYAVTANTSPATRSGTLTIAGKAFTVTQTGALTLSRSSLRFGGTNNGGTLTVTKAQTVFVTPPTGAGWTATPNASWIQVSPPSGSTAATVSITITNAGNALPGTGTLSGSVNFNPSSGPAVTLSISLSLASIGTTAVPYGSFDTPGNGSTGVTGSIAVTGWALDDIDMAAVRVVRDPVSGEPPGAKIFIGNAVFVSGARPDVEALYPNAPAGDRAGWGYLMLTNFLPNQGNGTFTLYAYADDSEGKTTVLGSKTITCSNATATRPFGAIDTPSQGGTVSGSLVNFGWALAGQPASSGRSIPTNGSTVQVYVDSVLLGTVDSYNNARSDIQALFPGYANTNGAVGVKTINTTTLANGVHTIFWIVTDNLGSAEGIGSRYFSVANSGLAAALGPAGAGHAAAAPDSTAARHVDATSPILGAVAELGEIERSERAVAVRRGFDATSPAAIATADAGGVRRVRVAQLERIVIDLETDHDRESATYRGYLIDGDVLRALPVGSHLDRADGTFAWTPGLAFGGTHHLVFVREAGDGATGIRVDVSVDSQPVAAGEARVVIDTPAAGGAVDQPFTIAGWAVDPNGPANGPGIDTLHVWAYPLDGAAPVWVGVAAYGGFRPDVAALLGPRFLSSGFTIDVAHLASGAYDIVVYGHSLATGSFGIASTLRVVIR